MKRVLLLIFPVIIFAGDVEVSLNYHDGSSSYRVESRDQTLKSQLDFPFEFSTIDLAYYYPIGSFTVGLSSSFMLKSNVKVGKDFDWKNSNLTVFSTSKNQIDRYFDVGLMLSREIGKDLEIFSHMHYKFLDMYWQDTHQEDYVKHHSELITKRSLEYQQTFYEYAVGLSYKVNFLKNISFSFRPSILYTVATIRDRHLLRGFYTVQNVRSFGYDVVLEGNYKLTKYSNIKLLLSHKSFTDNHLSMDYYNALNEKYLSLPSLYRYESNIVGIGYNFRF